MGAVWIIFSYLLGSIPFGYLIAKFYGIDILKVGTRQIGGTNVFRNVGKWQGALSGLLDLAKGFLVVWGAQKLGIEPNFQVFAGLAAVAGHNWPLYLKFRGGRGVATLFGAALALNPLIFGWSLIPMAIIALLWDSAVAILLFLFTAVSLSIFYKMDHLILFFSLAFILVLIIRLTGKIQEFYPKLSRTRAIFNRLIFDRLSGIRPFPRWRR